MITIAVINESTTQSTTDAKIKNWLPAFAKQWNDHLLPAWKVDDVKFTFVAKDETPPPGCWWLVWLDTSDQADALAYHDLTDEGLPLSKVFVKSIEADKASITVAATHELVEMAVDPMINLAAQDVRGDFWAYESADPVEADQYAYTIDGVLVTNFVLPTWYGTKGGAAPYDHREHCTDAFQILTGGYAQKFNSSSGWMQLNSSAVVKARAKSPPEGSRRARRIRGRSSWARSAAHQRRQSLRARISSGAVRPDANAVAPALVHAEASMSPT